MRVRTLRTSRGLAAAALTGSVLGGWMSVAPAAQALTTDLTIVAHRGDAAAAPESTNPAFRKAIAKGADAIEFDVRFTSTKYAVVLHDLTLDRTTNCSGPVTSYTVTRLAKCDAGSWFHSRYRGTRVPTLDSALKTIAGGSGSVKVLLHVKQLPDATMAKRIKDALARRGMTRRAIVIADTPSILTRMKSYGFTRLGLVFSTTKGWTYSGATHFLPYNATLDPARVGAAQAGGRKVWPVENRTNKPLSYLLSLGYIDGVLVNNLSATYSLLAKLAAPVVEIVDVVLPTPTPDPAPLVAPTADPAPTGEPTAGPIPTEEPAPDPAPTGDPVPDPAPTGDPAPTEEPAPDLAPTADPAPVEEPAPDPGPTEDLTPTEEPSADPAPSEEPAPDPVTEQPAP